MLVDDEYRYTDISAGLCKCFSISACSTTYYVTGQFWHENRFGIDNRIETPSHYRFWILRPISSTTQESHIQYISVICYYSSITKNPLWYWNQFLTIPPNHHTDKDQRLPLDKLEIQIEQLFWFVKCWLWVLRGSEYLKQLVLDSCCHTSQNRTQCSKIVENSQLGAGHSV